MNDDLKREAEEAVRRLLGATPDGCPPDQEIDQAIHALTLELLCRYPIEHRESYGSTVVSYTLITELVAVTLAVFKEHPAPMPVRLAVVHAMTNRLLQLLLEGLGYISTDPDSLKD